MLTNEQHTSVGLPFYTAKSGVNDFEKQYISLRLQEERIYSDQEVALLPEVRVTNKHKKEWRYRRNSSKRLMQHLRKKNKTLRILEIGCGNGWVCHQLSTLESSFVTGLDINFLELSQASRVFKHIPNLSFFYGRLQSPALLSSRFDVIVFAASLQYFSSLSEIMNCALLHLKEDGEVHILDTHFYKAGEVQPARKRSATYFDSIGYSQMINYYFHHSFEDLKYYSYQIMYDPFSFHDKLWKSYSPFYWICIKQQ